MADEQGAIPEALERLFDQAFIDGIAAGKSGDESILAGSSAVYARSALTIVAADRLTDTGEGAVPDELRALSERATPGPWAWEQCGEKEDVPVIGIAFPGDDPDCKAPYEGEFRDSEASRMTIAYDWHACDGHSPSANAAFTVAAVNYVRAALAAAPTPDAAASVSGANVCNIPPAGWWCSREAGHEGPCAARPEDGSANKAGGLWYRRWFAAMEEVRRLRESVAPDAAANEAAVPAGEYEARFVAGGAPTDCVDYGVVSLSKGVEVCRVWQEGDARLIANLLNAAAAPKIASDTGAGLREALAKEFRDASRGYGRAGTAEMRDGPYMSMGDAAGVYADLMLSKAASDVGDAFDLDGIKKLWRTGVETGRILQQADTSKAGFSEQAWAEAVRETDRHCYELDITNADHIVLWLEHQLNGHVGPLAYIACRILDAHEAALATDATDGATGGGEVPTGVPSQVPSSASHDDDEHGGIVTMAYMMGAKDERDRHAKATTPGGDLLEQAAFKRMHDWLRYEASAQEVGPVNDLHIDGDTWDHVFAPALKAAGDGGEA